MKKLITTSLIALIVSSCGTGDCKHSGKISTTKFTHYTDIVVIDSCEYITIETDRRDGGVCIIHKANCKNH